MWLSFCFNVPNLYALQSQTRDSANYISNIAADTTVFCALSWTPYGFKPGLCRHKDCLSSDSRTKNQDCWGCRGVRRKQCHVQKPRCCYKHDYHLCNGVSVPAGSPYRLANFIVLPPGLCSYQRPATADWPKPPSPALRYTRYILPIIYILSAYFTHCLLISQLLVEY